MSGGVYIAALVPALYVARWIAYPDDALAPIEGVWALLEGRTTDETHPLQEKHLVRFGYGRTLSYLPLALASSGLLTFSLLRAAVHAAIAPAVYAASRLLGAGRAASLVGAVAIILSTPLLVNLRSGHHAYMAIEMSSFAVLGFAMLVSGRQVAGGVLVGLSLPLAVMNHPFATPLVLLIPAAGLTRPRAAGRGVLLATILATLMISPHISIVVDAGGLETLARPLGRIALGLEMLSPYFSTVHAPEALLLVAPAAVLIVRTRTGNSFVWLAAASIVMVGLGAALGTVGAEVQGWYWKPVIPALAVCLSGVACAAGRRWTGLIYTAVIVAFCAQWPGALRPPPSWSIENVDVIHRVSRWIDDSVDEGGRNLGLVGYGRPVGRCHRVPQWDALVADALLAGRLEERLVTDMKDAATAPQLVHFEELPSLPVAAAGDGRPLRDRAPIDTCRDRLDLETGPQIDLDSEQGPPKDSQWIRSVAERLPAEAVLVGSGPFGLTVAVPDVMTARSLGELACATAPGPVRFALIHHSVHVDVRELEGRPPGAAACTVEDQCCPDTHEPSEGDRLP